MSLEDVLGAEAEQSEYARVVSKRIGELVAERISADGFLNASDDDLRNLALTILALVMNELGDEALASAADMAETLGFDPPSQDVLDKARQSALEANANRLYAALEEERAKAQKAAARNDGDVSESLALGITAALAIAFSDAAQGLATDLPVEVNGSLADELAGFFGALAGGGDGASEGTLTWITRRDESVCQEDGPSVRAPSGALMPPGAGTSCEARHGVTLPASDWISEGFPRDSRLLCSRFKRPRCRCVLSVSADVPDGPLNIGPDVARGKARGEAEALDLTDAHLNGISVSATGAKVDPNLWELKIRVTKRTPAPVGAP
jgi:hypothetical protein